MWGRQIKDIDEDAVVGWWGRQTLGGLAIKFIAVVVALAICTGAGHFAFGWFDTAKKVVSPENVTEQWRFAYDYHENLKSIAVNWCTFKKDEQAETNAEVRAQIASQRRAVETQYRTVQATYDGRLDDAFRAKLVAPPDVPRHAPTLEQTVAETRCME